MIVIVLLLFGIAGWLFLFGGQNAKLLTLGGLGPWGLAMWIFMAATLAWIPPVAGPVYRILQRLSRPSAGTRLLCSIAVAILTAAYLYATAVALHRQMFPVVQDEFSYLIQAHQLAKDRLWMPALPMAPFFESFQLFTKPVYASAYFPGTAITYIPGIWLHLPAYVTSLIVSGMVAGLLFWITCELLDAVAGGLAVLILLSDQLYRQLSIMTMGQMPLLLYSLLAVVAYLRWRSTRRLEWAIGVGFFLGLAAITRPVDVLCFAIPIATAMAIRCWKKKLSTAIPGLIGGMVPCLVLQLLLNHGITGDWLRTPFERYADANYPGSSYGFHRFNPMAGPKSDLPQMRKMFGGYRSQIQQHTPGNVLHDLMHPRLPMLVSQASPESFPMLILLLPAALLGFKNLYRFQRGAIGLLLATLPLGVLLYIPYVFCFPHYWLFAAPAIILGILLGMRVLCTAWMQHRRFATVGLTIAIAGITIAALPNWWGWNDDIFRADLLASVNQQLANLPHRPAVVLFRYDPNRNVNEEPVYNADVARPDDAPIIRAHDLGPLNREIYQYYADVQPDRFFYRYDERDRNLHELGTARDLAITPQ